MCALFDFMPIDIIDRKCFSSWFVVMSSFSFYFTYLVFVNDLVHFVLLLSCGRGNEAVTAALTNGDLMEINEQNKNIGHIYIYAKMNIILFLSALSLMLSPPAVQIVLIPLLHNKVSPPAVHWGFLLTVTHLLNEETSSGGERSCTGEGVEAETRSCGAEWRESGGDGVVTKEKGGRQSVRREFRRRGRNEEEGEVV